MLQSILLVSFLIASVVSAAKLNTGVEIRADSPIGQRLLQNARSLENNNNNNNNAVDLSFIPQYSIKFQGCHHVQQWNSDIDEENDVRIMTKRLARFRLCLSNECSNDKSSGCTSHFGDYVVDMDTFVEAYLDAVALIKDTVCGDAYNECLAECQNAGNNDASCITSCYDTMGVPFCAQSAAEAAGFDVSEYAYCKQYEFHNNNRRLEDAAVEYFIGTFCAEQGGEIHLGLFTDDTCTSFASSGNSTFYNKMGYVLPYQDTSLVSSRCLTCGTDTNNQGYYDSTGVCEYIYTLSGKCETRMNIDYPNESSCNYIEGIKIIREDGVIRTSATKKSKAAAVTIGLFTTTSVLLAAYVYYLRTKLGRAQINLAAAAHPLT
jgi:hypothetical protein